MQNSEVQNIPFVYSRGSRSAGCCWLLSPFLPFLAFFKQIVWIFYLLTLSPFIPGRPGGPGRPGRPGSPLGPYKKKICTSEKSKHLSKDKEKKCPAQAPLTPCLEVTVVKLSIASHSLRRVCVCAILPLITVRLSEECQENRELFQPAAWSPLTVKIDLVWDPASIYSLRHSS